MSGTPNYPTKIEFEKELSRVAGKWEALQELKRWIENRPLHDEDTLCMTCKKYKSICICGE